MKLERGLKCMSKYQKYTCEIRPLEGHIQVQGTSNALIH